MRDPIPQAIRDAHAAVMRGEEAAITVNIDGFESSDDEENGALHYFTDDPK